MFWQISKLVLTIWRNRLRLLFRRAPYLWLVVAVVCFCYLGGAYLTHDFFYQAISPLASDGQRSALLKPILTVGLFNFWGVSAFALLIIVLLFTPDDNIFRRIFLPLPISASQQRFGTVLPGLILLLIAQMLLWAPTLPVFIQLGLARPLPLLAATILGLLCYNAVTLTFYQAILYVTTLLFGADRAGIRTTTVGLTVSIGLILLMIPLIYAGVVLISGQPGWLLFVPSYWMMLVIDPRPAMMLAGLALLLVVSLICIGLYVFFIERCDKLALGTKGHWVPLRRLSFPRSFFLTSCLYELKSLIRDEQLVIGTFMIMGTWLAGIGAIVWTRRSNPLLSILLLQVTGYFITIMLCSAAHSSWGRDRSAYRMLASIPLQKRQFLDGKLYTNFLVSTIGWLLLIGSLAWISDTPALLLGVLPLLLIGCLFNFCLGIVLPYSPDDPLSLLPAIGSVTVLAFPAYVVTQYVQGLLAQIPGGTPVQIVVQYSAIVVLLIILYIAIHTLSQRKMEAYSD